MMQPLIDDTRRAEILSRLSAIEKDDDVKILYACESGSRAWGFPSQDSDYDVRFIYIHDKNFYLSINERRDVIERPLTNLIDESGWDIRKALQLLRKSNAPLLEWLQSPVIYLDRLNARKTFSALMKDAFSETACFYHYYHLARNTYEQTLAGELVKAKKYFYALRPLYACRYIEKGFGLPPMTFSELQSRLTLASELTAATVKLIEEKKQSSESKMEPHIPVIREFIITELERLKNYAPKKNDTPDSEVFNRAFREMLDAVVRSEN
jgi:uncharacterized protein